MAIFLTKSWEETDENNFELNIYTKSGDEKTIRFSVEVIELNKERLCIGVFKDITEKKKLEKEMARLDCLNIVGQMAASISHEIRNPLCVIRGFLQLLDSKEEYQKDREYIKIMIEELDRANSIINEFLSFAKNKPVNKQLYNLNSIILNLCPLIEAEGIVSDKEIKLELGGIPDLWIDEKEIRQLILNLCRNGLEEMSSGGVLSIKTGYIDGGVILSVTDQGKGINPAILDKVGTPFFTTKENGTGIGLAVCYSIAERNNAEIKIESGSHGTTVYVLFKI